MKNVKIIFVCTGNVCRSPMAEGLFKKYIKNKTELKYEITSAGIFASDDQPPSQNSIKALNEKNIDINDYKSKTLTEELIQWSTHIFCMSQNHVTIINKIFPNYKKKVFLMSEFISNENIMQKDITDPIGLSEEIYIKTRNDIERIIPSIFEFIEQTTNKKSNKTK